MLGFSLFLPLFHLKKLQLNPESCLLIPREEEGQGMPRFLRVRRANEMAGVMAVGLSFITFVDQR